VVGPAARSFQASASFRTGLFDHGGAGTDFSQYKPFNDYHLFDFGLGAWIGIGCFWEPKTGEAVLHKLFNSIH